MAARARMPPLSPRALMPPTNKRLEICMFYLAPAFLFQSILETSMTARSADSSAPSMPRWVVAVCSPQK